MTGRERRLITKIEQQRTVGRKRGRRRRPDARQRSAAIEQAEQGRPLPIHALHPREVGRRFGKIREHGADELLPRRALQQRIQPPLVTDRRKRLLADARAAERAGTMSRMHLHVVPERQHALERAIQLIGELARLRRRRADRDVRRRRRTAESPVKRRRGCDGRSASMRDVLGRVSRRVQERQREISHDHLFGVVDLVVRKPERRSGPASDGDAPGREFMRAGDEIGVDVGLDCRDDRDTCLARGLSVDAGVAPRIDDHRLLRSIAANQERALREPVVEKPLKHEITSTVCVSSNHSIRAARS